MTAASEFGEAFEGEPSLSGHHFSISAQPGETNRSMRVLERLASTLGVTVESFFERVANSPSSNEATAEEVADLTQAFVAIADPMMRRYCLDVVRAAGAESSSDGDTAASA